MNYLNINQIDSVLEEFLTICVVVRNSENTNDWLREWGKYDVITLFHKIDLPFSLSKVINDSM